MRRELGRLSQGYMKTNGTNTIFFIPKQKVPAGRAVTYFTIVCNRKPHKADKEQVRLCAGGDRLPYDGEVRTPTADLTTVKVHINSTISTRKAKYTTLDVQNFYLGTPMKIFEYAKIHRKNIPREFIDAYNLEPLFDDQGFMYVQIERGMYGLKQAGRIANDQLKKVLAPHGYCPCLNTPGL